MPGMPGNGWQVMASFRKDSSVTRQKLKPGTVRRIAGYARPYVRELVLFLGLNTISALIVVANPLLLKGIIDQGIVPGGGASSSGSPPPSPGSPWSRRCWASCSAGTRRASARD